MDERAGKSDRKRNYSRRAGYRDFPHMDFDGRIVAFRDLVYGRETPYDDNGHGTHVCGILGGSGRASGGKYQGAAPGCRFVVVKILDRRGNGRKQDILAAIDWVCKERIRLNIRILNISVGTTEQEKRWMIC